MRTMGGGGVTWPAGGVNIGAIKEPRRCFTPRDRPIDHPLSKHSADRIQRGKNLLPLPLPFSPRVRGRRVAWATWNDRPMRILIASAEGEEERRGRSFDLGCDLSPFGSFHDVERMERSGTSGPQRAREPEKER